MAATLKLKQTSGSTLWNCLDTTGAENPGNVACNIRHLGWASREPQVTLIESDARDGGWMGRSRQGLKSSTHVLHLSATSKDNLLQGYNALAAYLADGRGKYWEYKLNSASDTEYLDFTHGWLEGFPRDEESSFWIEVDTKDVALPLTIVHQPYFRLDEIDAALNKLTNATLWCDENNDGRPNDWTYNDDTLITAESISNGYSHRTVSTADPRDLQQNVSGAVAGDIWTGSFDAYTDDAANGRVQAVVTFLTAGGTPLTAYTGTLTMPSTDPDNPTRVSVTTSAADATTGQVRLALRSDNISAAAIVHSWRYANLSRTTTDPTFRTGVEIVTSDPTSTTAGQRAAAFPVFIPSDGPVKARLKLESFEAGQFGNPVYVAVLRQDHPADSFRWLNRRKYEPLETASLFNGTTAVADAGAAGSGSNAINVPFSGVNNLTDNRMTLTISTDLTALRGKWALFLRCAGTVSTDDYSVLVKWGTDTPIHSMPILSLPDLGTSYVDKFVGTFSVIEDADPANLSFNMYVRRDAGTGDFRGDLFRFVPVDQLAALSKYGTTALLATTNDYAITDPEVGATEIFSSAGAFRDFATIEGTTPFVLDPGYHMIHCVGNGLKRVKASLLFEPTRHA